MQIFRNFLLLAKPLLKKDAFLAPKYMRVYFQAINKFPLIYPSYLARIPMQVKKLVENIFRVLK